MGVVFLSDLSTEVFDTEIFEEIETETETIVEISSPADPSAVDAASTDWILIYIVFFCAVMFWMTRSER